MFALVSFVAALLMFLVLFIELQAWLLSVAVPLLAIVALVTGFKALARIRRKGTRGRGFAHFAIISTLLLALVVGLIAVAVR